MLRDCGFSWVTSVLFFKNNHDVCSRHSVKNFYKNRDLRGLLDFINSNFRNVVWFEVVYDMDIEIISENPKIIQMKNLLLIISSHFSEKTGVIVPEEES